MVEQVCDMREKGTSFETLVQHAIYEPRTFYPFPYFIFLCSLQGFLMLDMFFNNCWNTYAVSSAKTVSIWFFLFRQRSWNKTAQSFSILFFGEGEQLDIQRVFCFDTEIECGQPRFALPLEKSPSWQTMSSIETIVPSSSETTFVVSSVTPEIVSLSIPSKILIRRDSACVSRVPWK